MSKMNDHIMVQRTIQQRNSRFEGARKRPAMYIGMGDKGLHRVYEVDNAIDESMADVRILK